MSQGSAQEEEAGSEAAPEILSGADALEATADLIFQRLHADERFEPLLSKADLPGLASKLATLLAFAFEGEEWPAVHVGPDLVDPQLEGFTGAIMEGIQNHSDPESPEALVGAFDALCQDDSNDERITAFLDHIRGNAAEELAEEELAEEKAEHEGENAEDAAAKEAQDNANSQAGMDVNVKSFDELHLDKGVQDAALNAWRMFISAAENREAAGEAIYGALFESAPSLQSLFTTPRAIQAMRFMNGLASFVEHLNDPPALKILVETLGFGHLHLDVTVPRVVIFRDAIMDLFMVELAEKFTSQSREGWRKLLNYVGGAIIFVKSNYAERITCLLKSWRAANKLKDTDEDALLQESSDQAENSRENEGAAAMAQKQAHEKKKSKWTFGMKKNKDHHGAEGGKPGDAAGAHAGEKGNEGNNSMSAQNVPTTYPDMFLFNAAVMGFGRNDWMSEVLACFDNIVTNVSNSARLQEECDVLALRIAKTAKGQVNLAEYKSCMLASLRSLLPKDWDSLHEVSWTWLWDNVERLILRVHGKPPIWEKAYAKILNSLDEDQKYEFRKDIYSRFFTSCPAGQDFFKQSNTYLHVIADKIMIMVLDIYQYPVKMVDDISALGLRHVGYGIPTDLFGAFVSACVEVLMTRTNDENTIESFRWSLGLVAKMLVRTITEGRTIVMTAINYNSQKMLKKAIGCAPRGERANWMLKVQVGTQSISPLAWSIESGKVEAAQAIIKDLLTFRADRDRYYYGVDHLFERHSNIVNMLCQQAPDLLPKLFDGLIWRSRNAEAGLRRVNYYVKHLIVNEEGTFSKTLKWITQTKDPTLVCHPVVVLVSDIVWSRVAYRSFLYGKSWLFFTLVVFIVSQSVLPNLNIDLTENAAPRYATAACRGIIYFLSMTQLLYVHIRDTCKSYRLKTGYKVFGCIRIPDHLKQWQNVASFFLTISLLGMLGLEPILHCWPYAGEQLFDANCEETSKLKLPYTIFSSLAMFLYYSLLVDLTVISTRVSAFILVCIRMIPEVGLFLIALFFAILSFSSAASVLKHEADDFAGIHKGIYALFRMVLNTFSTDTYKEFRHEPVLLAIVCFFLIITVVFLVKMLIAQLSCAYSSVYKDMVGYARLQRAEIIVEIMPSVSMKRWEAFMTSLQLNQRLEFNPGDIGIKGGIGLKEPAKDNPTTTDMIRRFGGSTSPSIQWPEDDQDGGGDGDDRFERMEKLIQKALSRVTKSHGKGSKGGGSSQGMSGTGSKQSGSEEGGHDDDDDDE